MTKSRTHMEVELIAYTLLEEDGPARHYAVAERDDPIEHYEVVRKEVETDMDADDWTGEIILHEEVEFGADYYQQAYAYAEQLAKLHDCNVDEVGG